MIFPIRAAQTNTEALSNYIFHSVVCTFVFTGYGFGLYGRLERYQLYYVVAGCWAISLAASPIWLRHFRFGPRHGTRLAFLVRAS
jgi:uncharacterized membrane protein YeiB